MAVSASGRVLVKVAFEHIAEPVTCRLECMNVGHQE